MPKDGSVDHDQLRSLEARLKQARGAHDDVDKNLAAPSGPTRPSAALSLAWRISIEMVVAPLACGLLGWWTDRWLGIRPWAFFAFLLLGIMAGGLNAYRTLAAFNRKQIAAEVPESDATTTRHPAPTDERRDLGRTS